MHISVCVCTYKRPILLDNLLAKLVSQPTNNFFSYSIIVVDNDYERSAANIVFSHKKNSEINIEYFVEEKPNISLARNKAVENARGDLVAFIDDDEFPAQDWLLNLFKAYKKFNCLGVIGRINYIFPDLTHEWLKRLHFYKYEYKTGDYLGRAAYTANALLDRKLFDEKNNFFLPELGGGGGDTEFFYRNRKLGHNFVWCDEAVVYTVVPSERLKINWLMRRGFRYGTVNFRIRIKSKPFFIRSLIIFVVVILTFGIFLFLPFSLILGKHRFYDCLYYVSDCIGIILGSFDYLVNEYNVKLP